MARGVNKAILIGNLGGDPETRFTPSGAQVANFSLATSESWNDKQGERQERTEWHRLVLWNKLAEIAGQYLKKGSRIYVEGKIQTRNWEDQSGQKRYQTEIVVHDMQMLDTRDSSGSGGYQEAPPPEEPPPNSGGGEQQGSEVPSEAPKKYDDDLPF